MLAYRRRVVKPADQMYAAIRIIKRYLITVMKEHSTGAVEFLMQWRHPAGVYTVLIYTLPHLPASGSSSIGDLKF